MAANKQALWQDGYDEAVEVNQRALIDKVLARYSGEFTVFRELLQNSDDAQSNAVEIHFETDAYLKRKEGRDALGPTDDAFPDLKKTQVSQWTFKNNGIIFRDEDWSRLRKIAEGNPDEEKIGAFGVGFYSLFSVTEEPFVTSGGHGMQFHWKKDNKDQLQVRRGNLPPTDTPDPWTTFEMTLREPGTIPPAFDFTRFLASSITFMTHLCEVSLFLDEHRLVRLTKSSGVMNDATLLKGIKGTSGTGMMAVRGIRSAPIRIKAEVMHAVYSVGTEKPPPLPAEKPVRQAQSGFFSSLFSSFTGGSSTPQRVATPLPPPAPEDPPIKVHESSVTLTIFTADVSVSVDKKMEAELHRSTKKNPPRQLKYSLIYTGKDEYDNSVEEEKKQPKSSGSVFQGLRADLNGSGQARVFIGHATGQTTGIGGHMASRFIPTVERESIDLVDRNVAVWNRELLYVGGFLCRTAYELELSNIKTLWDGASSAATDFQPDAELKKWLTARFIHVLKFFSFHVSTPSSDVSRLLEAAFFACSTSHPFHVLSTAGVRSATAVREPDASFAVFLKRLPVLPEEVLKDASRMVASMRARGMIKSINFEDVLAELRQRPLTETELIACLRWWSDDVLQNSTQSHLSYIRRELLEATLVTFPQKDASKSDKILPLSSVQFFVNPRSINSVLKDLDGPFPDTLMPTSTTQHFTAEQLASLSWRELSVADWVAHISRPEVMAADSAYDLRISAHWSEKVLSMLTRTWPSLSAGAKESICAALKDKTCVPTSSGMKLPEESYFASANIFKDLPVVTFPSGFVIKGPMEKVLLALGVRKHVDLQVVFNRMIKTGDWSTADLVTYLVSVQANLSPDENMRLQSTSVFFREGSTSQDGSGRRSRYKAADLYEPNPTFRQLGLPTLDWGEKSKWKSGSEEARFLYRLGLKRAPPLDVIINLSASTDKSVQQHALKYLLDNLVTRYPEYHPNKYAEVAFVPAINAFKECLGKPNEVFVTAAWKDLGYLVAHPDVRDAVSKLGLLDHPPTNSLVTLLQKTPPKDVETAQRWFDILATRIVDFAPGELTAMSKLPIVPVSIGGAIRHLSPSQCYIGKSASQEFHSKLFTYVDFGKAANGFLSACGTKQEPSIDEIAQILISDPRNFFTLAGGKESYLIELRNVANNARLLSGATLTRMKSAPILLGTKRSVRSDKRRKSNEADLEEDDWELLHDLKKASDIVIVDDTQAYQLFGDSVFTAPQDDLLENFYIQLGSKRFSAIVQEEYKSTAENRNSRIAANTRSLILERLPLFLHEHTHSRPRVSLNWLAGERNFIVRAFDKLVIVKHLRIADVNITRHLEASAAAKRNARTLTSLSSGSIELWLAQSSEIDMYEVANALCRLIFESPKTNDALLFMTILSTDLRTLKRRGYNVDKILRQQQDARQRAIEAANANSTVALLPPPEKPLPAPVSAPPVVPPRPTSPPQKEVIPGGWDTKRPISPPTVANTPPPPNAPPPYSQKEEVDDQPSTSRGGRPLSQMTSSLNKWKQQLLPSTRDDSGSGAGVSPNPAAPPLTRRPNAPVTPQSSIRANVTQAINACKPEGNNLIQNRKQMQMIKESLDDGYCDISGQVGDLKLVGESPLPGQMGTMKVYATHDVPSPETLVTTKRNSLARFIHVITALSRVYSLPISSLHVFCDMGGGLIAFNRNGSIFLNLRYFEAWHDQKVERGDLNEAYISWYFTLAHEIAHNLVQPHNSEHEFYFSALCEEHIMAFGKLLSHGPGTN
ncbi:hypothetical protein CONPUDRAFT_86046 [Coniophora puteana RWD-64-598 SS2]|uniref:Sacsin/Nov domain-containing protein n=1 Tax=Coniophora puteana (strain RWD-64-598) TaxID=741705 RepID=R7SD22_CONPW|nr:uncharacterized protein CONPUDRAFT_86046 [Coniophora puteana RWD-64-598 SS2]EIW74063.1 hypothetical protein CONPUDRAFT_86046 [Coniophora puteana RWD-64-598 SS2]